MQLVKVFLDVDINDLNPQSQDYLKEIVRLFKKIEKDINNNAATRQTLLDFGELQNITTFVAKEDALKFRIKTKPYIIK